MVDAERFVVWALIVNVAVVNRVPSGLSGTVIGLTVSRLTDGAFGATAQVPFVFAADGLLQNVIAGVLSMEFALPSDFRIAVNPMYCVPPFVGKVGAPEPDPGITPSH
ncbi:MAG: hypothetical protein ACXVJ3_19470, partial [Ilumatobacteraceae bacterium]